MVKIGDMSDIEFESEQYERIFSDFLALETIEEQIIRLVDIVNIFHEGNIKYVLNGEVRRIPKVRDILSLITYLSSIPRVRGDLPEISSFNIDDIDMDYIDKYINPCRSNEVRDEEVKRESDLIEYYKITIFKG